MDRWCWPAASLCALCLVLAAGCEPPSPEAVWRKEIDTRAAWSEEEVARLSLIEIGERSLDLGERLEEEGLRQGALEAFERAAWAFEYHQRLTGEAPILLEDVRHSIHSLRRELSLEPLPPSP